MAKLINIENEKEHERFLTDLRKAAQSANLNFLIGSGCSFPAIPLLGPIENKVQEKIDKGELAEAEQMIFSFLKPFLEVSVKKIENKGDENCKKTLENHLLFLKNISHLLFERKSNILSKQATIFSTNYDLFIEKAFEGLNTALKLNDGFKRIPLLNGSFSFSSSEFFNSIYNNGTLYNYEVKIPSINLIKLHGSMSWGKDKRNIIFSVDKLPALLKKYQEIEKEKDDSLIEEFNQKLAIVLPKKDKFRDTLLNETYYELLRIFANELDRENTLLITEGFSFADEHILKISLRALRNPTLTILIFCFKKDELEGYQEKFSSFNNVHIVFSEKHIDFARFNSILKEVPPVHVKSEAEQAEKND